MDIRVIPTATATTVTPIRAVPTAIRISKNPTTTALMAGMAIIITVHLMAMAAAIAHITAIDHTNPFPGARSAPFLFANTLLKP